MSEISEEGGGFAPDDAAEQYRCKPAPCKYRPSDRQPEGEHPPGTRSGAARSPIAADLMPPSMLLLQRLRQYML